MIAAAWRSYRITLIGEMEVRKEVKGSLAAARIEGNCSDTEVKTERHGYCRSLHSQFSRGKTRCLRVDKRVDKLGIFTY